MKNFTLIKKKNIIQLPGYLILFLWVGFIAVLIGWIVIASFSTTRAIFTNTMFSSGFSLKNYIDTFVNNKVGHYFVNSIIYTSISCVAIILIAAPCSYALSRFNFRGNKFIQNMFIASLGVPIIMIILPVFSMASMLKITNTRTLLIILYISTSTPFTVYFLQSFFATLSKSFEEAAAIDGYGPIRTFWTIMMPLAQPGIITVTIFNFIYIWNEFIISLIFAGSTKIRPLSVGLFAMIQSMRYSGNWAGMFAAVVIVFIPTLLLYIFLSEKIIAGVTGGGVKG